MGLSLADDQPLGVGMLFLPKGETRAEEVMNRASGVAGVEGAGLARCAGAARGAWARLR